MKELVSRETITSVEVAELTGKRHSDVMRDIRGLLKQGVGQRNFAESYYNNAQNKKQPMYILNKKGSLILASGYNALLREKIIDRWEELEKQLSNFKNLKIESTKTRNGLTQEWKRQGCNKQHHYINLTKQEYKTLFNDDKKKKADMNESEIAKLNAFEAFQKWQLIDKKEVGYVGCKTEIEKSKEIFGLIEG